MTLADRLRKRRRARRKLAQWQWTALCDPACLHLPPSSRLVVVNRKDRRVPRGRYVLCHPRRTPPGP